MGTGGSGSGKTGEGIVLVQEAGVAARRLAGRYLGRVEILPTHLEYEPRGFWGCDLCGGVLVGVKSGRLYWINGETGEVVDVTPQEERSVDELASSADPGLSGGIQSVQGCRNRECKRRMLAGDGRSGLWFEGGDRQWKHLVVGGSDAAEGVTAPLRTPKDRVGVVRLLHPVASGSPSPIAFVSLAGGGMHLADLQNGKWIPIPSAPSAGIWWTLRRGHVWGRPEGHGDPWLMLSKDGYLFHAVLSQAGESSSFRMRPGGRLKEIPAVVASDRRQDRLRSILYGSDRELRVAILDEEGGLLRERVLRRGRPVVFVRVIRFFGSPFLLVSEEGGGVWTRPWDHPEDTTRDQDWLQWPPLPDDALFAHVRQQWGDVPDSTKVTFLLRNNQGAQVEVFNIRRVWQTLLNFDWKKWRVDGGGDDPIQRSKSGEEMALAEVLASQDMPTAARLLELVPKGGVDLLKAICRRLERTPDLTREASIRISEALLTAAMELEGGHREVQSLARELHRILSHWERGSKSAPAAEGADRFRAWLRLLRKHFVLGATWSEEHQGMSKLRKLNLDAGECLDALVYDVRLRFQGFDVEREWRVDSPVMALAQGGNGTGGEIIGATLADGSLATVEWKRENPTQTEKLQISPLAEKPASGGDFGNYSRVLAWREREPRWVVRRREPVGEGLSLVCDIPLPSEKSKYPAIRQIHALTARKEGGFLVGTRDMKHPLLWWGGGEDSLKEEAKIIKTDWEAGVHVRTQLPGGERRVWSIVSMGETTGGKEVWAVGAEDGHIRLGTVARERDQWEFTLLEEPFPRASRPYLGSSVRTMTAVRVTSGKGDRLFLAAGTEGGEIFVFEYISAKSDDTVAEREATSHLRLKFRDLLTHPVRTVLSAPGVESGEGQPDLLVLDHSGRLTRYSLGPLGKDNFLGRRIRRYRMGMAATAAVALGGGCIAVGVMNVHSHPRGRGGGWAGNGWISSGPGDSQARGGWVRIISLAKEWQEGAPNTTLLEGALAEIKNYHPFPLPLLASFPLTDPAMRVALMEERLASSLEGKSSKEEYVEVIQKLAEVALKAHPGTRDELRALLKAMIRRLTSGTNADKLGLLQAVKEVFLSRGRLAAQRRSDSRLRALLVRQLLVPPVVKEWSRAGNGDVSGLGAWVEMGLQDRDKVVRMETLRALAETFRGLRSGEGFPSLSDADLPPLLRLKPMLDPLVRYLCAHHPRIEGHECDAGTWSAISVLMGLMRLYPDGVWMLCDHLSVNKVNPLVFAVLKRRLTASGDTMIREKVKLYMPWEGKDLDVYEIKEFYLRWDKFDLDAYAEPMDSPDRIFKKAFETVHHWIKKGIALNRPDDLKEFAEVVERDGRSTEITLRELSEEKKGLLWSMSPRRWLFDATRIWMKCFIKSLVQQAGEKSGAIFSSNLVRWLDDNPPAQIARKVEELSPLFEPEAGFIRTLLSHWRLVLEAPAPRKGDHYGDYDLGKRHMGRDWLFSIKDRKGQLIRISEHRSEHRGKMWEALKSRIDLLARGGQPVQFPRILEVGVRFGRPFLRMEELEGKDLHTDWEEEVGARTQGQKWELAWEVCIDIGTALMHLHDPGSVPRDGVHGAAGESTMAMSHGDLVTNNILRERQTRRFYLLDFETCSDDKMESPPPGGSVFKQLSPNPNLWKRFKKRVGLTDESRWDGDRCRKSDVAALVQLLVQIVMGTEAREGRESNKDGKSNKGGEPNQQIQEPDSDCLDSLKNKAPVYLRDWADDLNQIWKAAAPRSLLPSAPELVKSATSTAQAGFVSGVSQDTEDIRNKLVENLQGARAWKAQGGWADQGNKTVPMLLKVLVKCEWVVVLLGCAQGAAVAEDTTIPSWMTGLARVLVEKWEATGWDPVANPLTYSQCELLAALRMNKELFCFTLEGWKRGGATHPVQRALESEMACDRDPWQEVTAETVGWIVSQKLMKVSSP